MAEEKNKKVILASDGSDDEYSGDTVSEQAELSSDKFIDDEPYEALLNPDNTGLFPSSYDPSNKDDNLLDPDGEFCSYLDGLAKASDAHAYIKEHSFGQPMIDSSHPDWSFYRKVSKSVKV